MKWSKFLQLCARHPFIVSDLNWGGEANKEFVRTKVGFIACRPFESLDLSTKESSSSTPLKSEYRFVKMECYKVTQYELYFHVEGEGRGTRLRYVGPNIGDGSIQAHIDEIIDWFEDCEVFRGKQLIWERVIKRTMSGSSYAGMTQMNLEIYLFPL